MVEPSKITDKATELAGQAMAAAGPIVDKAQEIAGAAAEAAAPLKDRAEELVARAGEIAAQGVSAAAEGLDKVTGGKLSDQISSVSSRIEEVLDPEEKNL